MKTTILATLAFGLAALTAGGQTIRPVADESKATHILTSKDTLRLAYNAGIGRVRSWLKMEEYSKNGITLDEIPITETRNYVKKVTSARDKYKELYFSE